MTTTEPTTAEQLAADNRQLRARLEQLWCAIETAHQGGATVMRIDHLRSYLAR